MGMKTFASSVPRLGQATGGMSGGAVKSAGSSTRLSSAGVKPKVGKGVPSTSIRGGALKSNVVGGSFGKARVKSPVRGGGMGGLINRG